MNDIIRLIFYIAEDFHGILLSAMTVVGWTGNGKLCYLCWEHHPQGAFWPQWSRLLICFVFLVQWELNNLFFFSLSFEDFRKERVIAQHEGQIGTIILEDRRWIVRFWRALTDWDMSMKAHLPLPRTALSAGLLEGRPPSVNTTAVSIGRTIDFD